MKMIERLVTTDGADEHGCVVEIEFLWRWLEWVVVSKGGEL